MVGHQRYDGLQTISSGLPRCSRDALQALTSIELLDSRRHAALKDVLASTMGEQFFDAFQNLSCYGPIQSMTKVER